MGDLESTRYLELVKHRIEEITGERELKELMVSLRRKWT